MKKLDISITSLLNRCIQHTCAMTTIRWLIEIACNLALMRFTKNSARILLRDPRIIGSLSIPPMFWSLIAAIRITESLHVYFFFFFFNSRWSNNENEIEWISKMQDYQVFTIVQKLEIIIFLHEIKNLL